MLIVTSMDGTKTEPLNKIQGFEMDEEVNGAFMVKFASFSVPNNPGHDLLEEKPVISVEGYDFRLTQLKANGSRKDVTAISTFYDLVGHRQEEIYGGTRTLNDFASFIFKDTGWTFTSEVTGYRLIPNFGEKNVIVLKEALCVAFECEMKILPNKRVHFAPKIGPDNDAQYRRGHNIKSLAESIDWSKMRTKVTGYGANGLVVTYTSPNAEKYGESLADPIHDDEITESSTMLERLKQELIDYPEAFYELDTVELTNKELGERVWLIDEVMKIEYQTRVLAKKSIIRGNKIVPASVVLGTTIPKTNSDILASQKVEIDENRKEYRSKFEQTNERITLEVEEVNSSIATLELKADNINLSVNNRITNEVAAINVRADNITLSVSGLDNRMGQAESSISIQAGKIEQKVELSQFNGPTVTSLITQDPYSISQMAQKLNLQGLVTVTNLNTPGQTVIDGGNVYGSSFVIGRGTGSLMTMTAIAGSHTIISNDAAGFALQSNGSLSLRAGSGYAIFTRFAPLAVQDGMRVDGGIAEFNTSAYLNSSPIINQNALNNAVALLETQIKAWANGKFAPK